MPEQFTSAKAELQQRRQRANWSMLLLRPIPLGNGAVLHTLKDAALRVLQLPPEPASQLAAERLIDAAQGEGDMIATEIAVRLAIGQSSQPIAEADQLKSLYASLTEVVARKANIPSSS